MEALGRPWAQKPSFKVKVEQQNAALLPANQSEVSDIFEVHQKCFIMHFATLLILIYRLGVVLALKGSES